MTIRLIDNTRAARAHTSCLLRDIPGDAVFFTCLEFGDELRYFLWRLRGTELECVVLRKGDCASGEYRRCAEKSRYENYRGFHQTNGLETPYGSGEESPPSFVSANLSKKICTRLKNVV